MKTSMRLLLRRASVVFVLSAGSIVATTGIDNPVRFDELIRQGRAAFLASDLDRAESAYNEACPAEFVQAYPVAKSVTCENLLASVDEARGNLVRAEQRYLHAVARAEQAGKAYQPLYCAKLIDLGEYFHRRARTTEAALSLRKGSDLARQLTDVVPDLLPKALIRLGSLYSDLEQPDLGRPLLLEALGLKVQLSDTEIASAQDALGKLELGAGNRKEAESHLREAVALASASLGEDHPVTAIYQSNLAKVLIAQRQYDGARLLLRRAQLVLERRGRPNVELAVVYLEMSDVASSQRKLAEAEDYAHRAISILNLQPESNPATLATAQIILAGINLQANDTVSADRILPQAIEAQRAASVSPRTLALSLQLLAGLRAQQRNWSAAEALYREAIGIHRKDNSANPDPALASLLRGLAEVLKRGAGQKNEIRALEAEVREIARSARQGKSFSRSVGPKAL